MPPPFPPHRVRIPVNVHHWERIAFLHWPFAPDAVQALLPPELAADTYDGMAWVGVTPFFIRVRPFGLPVQLPGWAFPETNLRTYARGPDGRSGIWFLRMEVPALWFVASLRLLGLPYVRRAMTVDERWDAIHYRSQAAWPDRAGCHDIRLRPGALLEPPEGGPLEIFLTARWDAYHRVGPQLLRTSVEHRPWDLHTAEVDVCDVNSLFQAANLAAPVGPPLAHFSPGVTVKVGAPFPLRCTPAQRD